jgi:hypothetical protein
MGKFYEAGFIQAGLWKFRIRKVNQRGRSVASIMHIHPGARRGG